MSNHMKAQGIKDLHYSWYLKIPSNCCVLKAHAILRELYLYHLPFLQNQSFFFILSSRLFLFYQMVKMCHFKRRKVVFKLMLNVGLSVWLIIYIIKKCPRLYNSSGSPISWTRIFSKKDRFWETVSYNTYTLVWNQHRELVLTRLDNVLPFTQQWHIS